MFAMLSVALDGDPSDAPPLAAEMVSVTVSVGSAVPSASARTWNDFDPCSPSAHVSVPLVVWKSVPADADPLPVEYDTDTCPFTPALRMTVIVAIAPSFTANAFEPNAIVPGMLVGPTYVPRRYITPNLPSDSHVVAEPLGVR